MNIMREIKEIVVENGVQLEKVTIYYPTGSIQREAYYKDGKLHRENKPAIVEYFRDGRVWYDAYFINGEIQV